MVVLLQLHGETLPEQLMAGADQLSASLRQSAFVTDTSAMNDCHLV